MLRVKQVIHWMLTRKPVRVFQHFSDRRGFLLSAGLSYHSIFAVFAGVWVGFAIGGLVLRGSSTLSDAFFTLLARSVPGLIAWAGSDGVIDPSELFQTQILGITGVIAAIALTLTAVGWLTSARGAVRALFDLPAQEVNFLLLKLKDLGLAIGFGVALIASAALSVVSTQAFNAVLFWLGIPQQSPLISIVGSGVLLAIMVLLDAAVLAALFRILSNLVIPRRRLLSGALLGAVGLGILKVLGNLLLGGASRNPLLASFAILIGLLIWFNLICTVILGTASWIAVGMNDDGLVADPRVAAERDEHARRERERLLKEIEAERASEGNFFTRMFRRPRSTTPTAKDRDSGSR